MGTCHAPFLIVPMTSNSEQIKPPFRSSVAQVFLLIGAMTAVFLAGSERQGATGIFLSLAGASMIFLAPNRVVPWRYWILCGGIFFTAALSLLPQGWFFTPDWRLELQNFQGLPPLPLISMAPRETVYWLMLLLSAVLVGLFSLGHPVRSEAKMHIALLGTLSCAAYAGVAIYAKKTGWEYPFFEKGGWSPPDFGFFPNRNHTAALLVIGSILALGIVRTAWSNARPLLFLLSGVALSTCVYALLFYSISRGGVLFLSVGVVLWAAALGRNHLTIPLLVSALAIGAAMIWIFLASEGLARDRVLEMVGIQTPKKTLVNGVLKSTAPANTAFSDMRSKIFEDTARIIRNYPLTGTGLGTYAYVYPFYARASLGEAAAIHPESDWFMIAAESGIPCLICILALLVFLIRDMLGFSRSESWPLRWGIIAAALIAGIHGLVDVPIHRIEIGWFVLMLAGLAFGNPTQTVSATSAGKSWLAQRLVLGIGGAAILTLGILLIGSQWFGLPPFPPYRPFVAVQQMRQLADADKHVAATNLARSEIPFSPMARGLYRELGFREIKNGGDPVVADAVFAAERALNPGSAQIPLDQGRLWLRDDPMRTAILWGEALRKHMAIEKAGGYANTAKFYEEILGQAAGYPGLVQALGRYAKTSPETWLVWTARAPKGQIEAVAKDTEFLKTLDFEGQRRFLLSWWNGGNRDALEAFLAGSPEWEKVAWPIRVNQMIERKDFKGAVEGVQHRYGINLSLPDVDLKSDEVPTGLAERVAFFAARGNMVSARRIISESLQANDAEGFRLQCILAIKNSDWPAVWKAMEAHLRETKRSNLP